jgi:cell division protein FtsB
MSDKPGGRKRSAAERDEHDEEDVSSLREKLAAKDQQIEQLAASNQQLAAISS